MPLTHVKRPAAALALVTALAALLAIAGCSTAPTDSDPKPSPSSPSAASKDSQVDPATQIALDARWTELLATYPDAERPSVPLVRFVAPEEWPEATANCMHDLGFPEVLAAADGGVESGPIPTGQASAYAVAMYTCAAQFPMDPKYTAPLSDDRLGLLYTYFKDELRPCLENEGFSVAKAPSRDVFIDSYATTGGWDLYAEVQVDSQAEWDAINKKCPQAPDNLFE